MKKNIEVPKTWQAHGETRAMVESLPADKVGLYFFVCRYNNTVKWFAGADKKELINQINEGQKEALNLQLQATFLIVSCNHSSLGAELSAFMQRWSDAQRPYLKAKPAPA